MVEGYKEASTDAASRRYEIKAHEKGNEYVDLGDHINRSKSWIYKNKYLIYSNFIEYTGIHCARNWGLKNTYL